MPTYVTFRGRRVSTEWNAVLTDTAKRVNFRLNSGHRSMAEQRELRRRYLAGTGNLAAIPSPNAPHIRVGRIDHACDIDMFVGDGVRGVDRDLRRQGVRVAYPVAGEGWHVEVPAADLRRLTKSLSDPLKAAGFSPLTASRIRRVHASRRRNEPASKRRALVRLLAKKRRSVWRAGEKHGWTVKRRAQYRSLKAAT